MKRSLIFVEEIRILGSSRNTTPSGNRGSTVRRSIESDKPQGAFPRLGTAGPVTPTACELMQKYNLEAEKFQATIEPPPKGTYDVEDDDYFHLACHMDASLKAKIEKGEYIDLEKLLPRQ